MKKTQKLIIIVGEANEKVRKEIAGFHACTVIMELNKRMLKNVWYFNKNAVYFCKKFDMAYNEYNPIVIRLSYGPSEPQKNVLSVSRVIADFPMILAQESNNVDVGDHDTQDSKGMVEQPIEKCLLCQINHGIKKDEHIVFNSSNFYVVPGRGAFFPGYLMIVPKRHVMSFAQLTCNEFDEFITVLNDLRSILEAIYKDKVFAFECGSGEDGAGKHETSIVHAHFHLAVTDMPVLEAVQESGLFPCLIEKERLPRYCHYPYMLYVDQDDNWYVAGNPDTYFPRQHPRQILANYLKCYDVYNWREHPFEERMDQIAEKFRNFCKHNMAKIPMWTRENLVLEDPPVTEEKEPEFEGNNIVYFGADNEQTVLE